MNDIGWVVGTVFWIAGLVMAKGFWSTAIAVVLPPWAWYIVMEYALDYWDII